MRLPVDKKNKKTKKQQSVYEDHVVNILGLGAHMGLLQLYNSVKY